MLPSSLLKLYFLHLPVEVLPFATLSGQKQNANYLNGFSVASGTSGRFSLRISSGLPPKKFVQTLPVGLRPLRLVKVAASLNLLPVNFCNFAIGLSSLQKLLLGEGRRA